nr:putative ribonuclease H-like domain-containing protein [Tanacetum cinerariifolium]
MELAVEQHCAEKTQFQTKMENVLHENDGLLTQALSVKIVNIVVHNYMNVDCLNVDAYVHCVTTEDIVSSPKSAPTFAELFEINDLKAQVDVASLVPKLRKNRTAHTDYIRHTQEEAATLREIVESERLLSPLNTSLAYASNIDSNTPVLSSTGVTLVSSASGSKSQDNTKKNRIRRTQKKAKETKLGDHLRTVKSSLNKASIVDSTATSSVRLNVPVRRIRTDNGTEFVNQTLRDYYEEVGISHETSVAPSPQQNGVVERHNRTLIEAARTMLIYAQ